MATLTYTYSFTNGTAANAVEVNNNFNAASNFVNTELVNRDGSVAMTGGLTLPGDPSSPSQAARKQYVDNAVAAALPVATIIPWAGTVSIPAGYLLCDGTSYVQATYPNLYAAILLTYSVAPHQTVVAGSFRVPDLSGRLIAGKEATATRLTAGLSGVAGSTLGAVGGNQLPQTLPAQNPHQHGQPSHYHVVGDHQHGIAAAFNSGNDPGTFRQGTGGVSFQSVAPGGAGNTTWGGGENTYDQTATFVANNFTGSSQNVQPTMVLNYLIKT